MDTDWGRLPVIYGQGDLFGSLWCDSVWMNTARLQERGGGYLGKTSGRQMGMLAPLLQKAVPCISYYHYVMKQTEFTAHCCLCTGIQKNVLAKDVTVFLLSQTCGILLKSGDPCLLYSACVTWNEGFRNIIVLSMQRHTDNTHSTALCRYVEAY